VSPTRGRIARPTEEGEEGWLVRIGRRRARFFRHEDQRERKTGMLDGETGTRIRYGKGPSSVWEGEGVRYHNHSDQYAF
jgi:hypothetical protein